MGAVGRQPRGAIDGGRCGAGGTRGDAGAAGADARRADTRGGEGGQLPHSGGHEIPAPPRRDLRPPARLQARPRHLPPHGQVLIRAAARWKLTGRAERQVAVPAVLGEIRPGALLPLRRRDAHYHVPT
ncbi:unnamed protein product, partial [Closterium sp. NIES-53]